MIKPEEFHLSWENNEENQLCMSKGAWIKEGFVTFFSTEGHLEIT